VDLDGDGHIDLLSGSWPGELFFFRGGPKRTFAAPVKLKDKSGKFINVGGGVKNTGAMILVAGDAKYEQTDKGAVILYNGERIEIPEGKEAGITGTASAVHACDWDGDGKLDLLVGDFAMQKPDLPPPSPEEKAVHDKLRKEMESVQARWLQLIEKSRGDQRPKSKEERDKLSKEMSAVSQRMQELYQNLPREAQEHGWVWLFLRQTTPTAKAAER
jgi:hypothetical protein